MEYSERKATMFQQADGYINCRECNASYESEAKLREHQRMSHRGRGTEETPQAEAGIAQSEDPEVQVALRLLRVS
jgi:hypothetical protein